MWPAWDIKLRDYAARDLPARLQLLIADSSAESVRQDRRRLRAVLTNAPKAEQGASLAIVTSNLANSNPSWCQELFSQESQQLMVRQALFCTSQTPFQGRSIGMPGG